MPADWRWWSQTKTKQQKMQFLQENTNKEGKIEKDNKETKQDLNIDKYDSSI